ncbi:MAG: hypothetical protein KDE31_34560, partial [Caldilineaceae bacterium]|nr:hypothetical protein [Caldilineaceae bacterium]
LGQVLESDLQLEQAAASFRQVLEVAGDPPWPAACEAYFGLARIHYQWNQLSRAQELGERGLQMAHQLPNVDTPATCMAFLAKVRLAHGDLEGAEQYLQDAERFVHARAIAHRIPEVAALRIQILLRQGAVAAASQVAEQQTVPVSQARVALAQAKADTALAILKPLYAEMVAKAWRDEQLQLLILQSLAFQQHGDHESAMQALTSAMTLAEPAGFLRIFLDEGDTMHQLLQTAAVHEINPIYCKRLLAEFAKNDSTMPAETISPRPAVTQPAPAPSTAEVLIEPLSDREVEVLHLIAQGLSNREIGERLFIALDTVKGHNRKLFGKLQVQRRTEAVARARDLGLI